MSRIGRMPVAIPAGVTVKVEDGNKVTVKGPKGELSRTFAHELTIEEKDGQTVFMPMWSHHFNHIIRYYLLEKN